MKVHIWIKAKNPPSNSRCVMMRFDKDGSRDAKGFYWSIEGAWYRSDSSKAKRNSVHPVEWRELMENET